MNNASKELYDSYKKVVNLIGEYNNASKRNEKNEIIKSASGILRTLQEASYKTSMIEVCIEIDKIKDIIDGGDSYSDSDILMDCLIRCKTIIEKNLMKRNRVYIISGILYEFCEVIKFLEREGFDVIARENFEDAIDMLYTTLPDIILIDNDLSNKGMALFERIRDDGPISNIPVIFTGKENEGVKIEILNMGALDYIEKPFSSSEVFIKLKNFIELTKNSIKNTVYDVITGAYSRNYGREIAQNQFEVSKNNNDPYAILLVDIDKMAEINLKLGKSMGNYVIKDLAELLKNYVSKGSFVYRYSGDKFALIMLGYSIEEILSIMGDIKGKLGDLSKKHGVDISFTGGLAVATREVKTFQELRGLAEESLKMGKHSKRGEIYVHSLSLEKKEKGSILIVDGDPIILSILSSRYRNKGYKVLTSQTGREAFSIMKEQRIDVVITDIIIPDITGSEIIGNIKEKDRSVKIIILSAQRSDVYIDTALRAGADEYVIKPFSPAELDLKIQKLIG